MNTSTTGRKLTDSKAIHSPLMKWISSLLFMVMLIAGVILPHNALAAPTQAQIDTAINDGVAWLVLQQKANAPAVGSTNGSFGNDSSFRAASTGFAVAALAHNAERLGKKPLAADYAYKDNVQRGLNYLFNKATYDATNHWVYWGKDDSGNNNGHDAYESGIPLMAISRSGEPTAVVGGDGPLKLLTYKEVAQYAANWLATAQDTNSGGWAYSKASPYGDQSATGWAAMGIGYAVYSMGCDMPANVVTRLAKMNTGIQSSVAGNTFGGADYTYGSTNNWHNVYKTGHLLYDLGLVKAPKDSNAVKNALKFMDTNWAQAGNVYWGAGQYGWRGSPPNNLPSYSGMFSSSKGFSEYGIETFSGTDNVAHDWYQDFATVIVSEKARTGQNYWVGGDYPSFDSVRGTSFAVLTLLRAQSFLPPIATSSPATGITTTQATVNGNLTSMGTSTSVAVSFQYGTSPGVYTQTATPTGSPYSGLSAFYVDLTGLAINTTFYYRSKAVGTDALGAATGTGYSAEVSFTTPNTLTYTPVIANGTANPAVPTTGISPINNNTSYSYTFLANEGYHLTGVSSPCGGTATPSDFSSDTVTSATFLVKIPATTSCLVTAATAATPFIVTATAGTGGTLTAGTASQQKTAGQTASYTFTANTNYHITSINGCGVSYTAPGYTGLNAVTSRSVTTTAISGACDVAAVFTADSFGITATVTGGNGTLSCPASALYGATDAACTIVPATGYHLYELKVDGVPVKSNINIKGDNTTNNVGSYTLPAVTAARSVNVKFRKNTYLVTAVAVSDGGSGAFSVVDTSNIDNYADHGSSPVFYAKEIDGSQLNSIAASAACGNSGVLSPVVNAKNNIYTADAINGISGPCTATATFGADTTPPVITLFSTSSSTQTLVIPVNFTATDNVAVKEYCITHTTGTCGTLPESVNNCVWTPDNSAPFAFPLGTAEGQYKLCARARDYAKNVSLVSSQTITIDMFNRVNIPRTGQEYCYGDGVPVASGGSGGKIACGSVALKTTTQDGTQKAGLPWPSPRFSSTVVTAAGPTVLTDMLTGLMYPQITTEINVPRTWQAALDYVNSLNTVVNGVVDGVVIPVGYGGYSDWRLPNRNELATLVNRSVSNTNGWLNPFGFLNAQSSYYWTSTTDMSLTPKTSAWAVHFNEGSIDTLPKTELHYLVPVRAWQGVGTSQPVQTNQALCYNTAGTVIDCINAGTGAHTGQDGDVKAGVPWPPSNRFGNADGIAAPFSGLVGVDRMNSLMWLKDAGTPANSIVTDPATTNCTSGVKNWQDALDYIVCLNSKNHAGYNDWRLPNTVELQTLFNGAVADGQNWLQNTDTVGFSTVKDSGYWSSTTDVNLGGRAWMYDVKLGKLTHQNKVSSTYDVWPVRGGLIGGGAIQVTPAEPDFGKVAYLATDSKVITITNTGTTSTLEITSIFVDSTGADAARFSLAVSGTVNGKTATCGSNAPLLAANNANGNNAASSCNVVVTFAPLDAANRSAVLIITSSDSTNPSREVILSGAGASTLVGTVTGGINGNGSNTCLPETVAAGDSATCTLVPNVGYHLVTLTNTPDGSSVFGSIVGNPYIQSTYTLSNVLTTHTVNAGFAINTYAVNASVYGGNGTISCTPGGSPIITVGHNVAASCTMTPVTGYHLSSLTDNTINVIGGVTGLVTGVTSYSIGSVTAEHTLIATFAINTYDINASKTGNGAIDCTPNPVEHSASSVCTVTPSTGYELTGLSDNGTGKTATGGLTGGTYTITATGAAAINHSVVATFTVKHYTVTISGAANGSFAPASGQIINHGDTVTITLTPAISHEVNPAAVDIGANACPGTRKGNQFDLGPVVANCTLTTGYKIRTFTVTAAQAGVGGAINPNLSRTIDYGTKTSFFLDPAIGYQSSASGCGGSFSVLNTFTTGSITSDCNVGVLFNDTTPPVVTVFALPTANSSLSVPIALLTNTDNSDVFGPSETANSGEGVTGWYLTSTEKGAAAPSAPGAATNWLNIKPIKFSLPANTGAGIKTLYVWVRDAAGNVSAAKNSDVKIVFPAQTRLIRTGQELCYNAAGAPVECANTTDTHDGKIKAGVPWVSSSRFVDWGDGSFTDTATGLMWAQSADVKYIRSGRTSAGLVTWQGALSYIDNMNATDFYTGYNDWRLPNRTELTSIMNYGSTSLSSWLGSFIPPFTDIPSTPNYWSSTTAPSPGSAYQLKNDGTVVPSLKNTTAYMLVVRTPLTSIDGYIKPRTGLLVTGQSTCFDGSGTGRLCADAITAAHTGEDGDLMSGVPFIEPRFVSPDGSALVDASTVVLDQASGLSWARNAATPLCTVPADNSTLTGTQSWANALKYVTCLNDTFFAGKGDWRLPNVLEISTLANSSQVDNDAWLNTQGFTTVQDAASYWTSDSLAATATTAFKVNMGSFAVTSDAKAANNFVWPVRGGYIYTGNPFSLSAGAINFGTVKGGTTSEPVIFTITNDSGGVLSVNTGTTGSDTTLFTLHNDGGGSSACGSARPIVLPKDESCTLAVSFTASADMGPRSATLEIASTTGYTAPLPLSAIGGPKSFRMTILPSAGGTVVCVPETVEEASGRAFSCQSIPNAGKSFIKITDTPQGGVAGDSTDSMYTIWDPTSSHTVLSTFGDKYYTLGTATNAGNGSGTFSLINPVKHGDAAPAITVTADAGSHLVSVTGCAGGLSGTTYTTGPITEDCTITARFDLNTFPISVSSVGNGTFTCLPSSPVNYNSEITCTATAAAGSTLTALLDNTVEKALTSPYIIASVKEAHVLVATFTVSTYTVTGLVSGGIGTISPAGEQANKPYGDTMLFALTANAGYHVASVSGCGGNDYANSANAVGSYNYSTAAITETCSVTATFAANNYSVIPAASGNGTLTPDVPLARAFGTAASFVIQANTGNHIVAVTGCSGNLSDSTYAIASVAADCTVNAEFALNTYTVTPSVIGHGTITPAIAQTVTYGSKPAFILDPEAGYRVKQVSGECGGFVSGNTFSTKSIAANCTVVAEFEAIPYFIVTDVPADTTTITPSGTLLAPISVGYAATPIFTITPPVGSTVAAITGCNGVTSGPQLVSGAYTYTAGAITADCTVRVTTVKNSYTVSLSPGANGSIAGASTTGLHGSSLSFTTVPIAGYSLDTYSGCGATRSAPNTLAIASLVSNCTITVTFKANQYTVSTAGDGVTFSPTSQTGISHGSKAAPFTIGALAGYNITGVVGGAGCLGGTWVPGTSTFTTANVTANCTVTASTNVQTFTVTPSAGAGGSISAAIAQTVIYYNNITFTITPTTGWHIVDVLADSVSVGAVGSYTFNNVKADHTISASFAINTYTVTATAGTNGTITPGATHNYGDSPVYTVTPNANYHIASITIDGGAPTTYNDNSEKIHTETFISIAGNHTITATFAIDTFAVGSSVNGGGSGTVTCLPATVNYGGSSVCTITPVVGNKLTALTDGGSVYVAGTMKNGGSYTISSISADHTIVGTFEAYQWKVTASATGNGGSLTPVSIVHGDTDDQPAFKLVWYDGYNINPRVDTCGSITTGTENPYNLVVQPLTKNCDLTFTFVKYNGWFEILTTAGAGGSITPISAVYPSSSKTITVTPNIGYHIISVTVDSVVQTLTDLKMFSVSFTNIGAGHTVNAIFAADKSDFNGDGRTDILWTDTTNNTYTFWNMNGVTKTSETPLINTPGVGWAVVAKGDFDKDGKVDLLWRNQTTGQNIIWFMNGAVKKGEVVLASLGGTWDIAGCYDLDKDGNMDILWRNSVTGANSVWIMNGSIRTKIVSLPLLGGTWQIVGTGDFNNDGNVDILWRNPATGANSVWIMDGVTRTKIESLALLGGTWQVAGTGDFNNDGKIDILWRNPSTGANSVWVMDGVTRTRISSLPILNGSNWQIVGK